MKRSLKAVKRFTIDRKWWLRGRPDEGELRDSEGKQCCLGIYLRACGVGAKTITRKGEPREVLLCETWLTKVKAPYVENTALAKNLMAVNDNGDISEKRRESRIAALFAKAGVRVTFKGSSSSSQGGTQQ